MQRAKRELRLPDAAILKKIGIIGGGVVLLAAVVLAVVLLIPGRSESTTMDITVPNLIGSIYSENSTYVDGVTVPADKIVYVHNENQAAGKIIAQEPAGGVFFEDVEGVEIVITVSLGPEMMDFILPMEHRTDMDTAKAYLRANYAHVTVYETALPATTPADGIASGTVLGAVYRTSDGTEKELSLDGGKIYKNKGGTITFFVQP